jgi:hypothetical protein
MRSGADRIDQRISAAAAAPTQSASVEASSSTPSALEWVK